MILVDPSIKNIRGFTLVELMVALFIMAAMTGMLLENYPDSTLRITLLNNTHNLALLIREAQIRGSAVDSGGGVSGGYGIRIIDSKPSEVILFGDKVTPSVIAGVLDVGNGVYEDGSNGTTKDIIKSTTDMGEKFLYKKLCITGATPDSFLCNENNIPHITSLTVSFSRPNVESHIYINNSTTTDFSSACIQLYSPKSPESGHVRSVRIYHSGMITTTTTSCD